MRFGRRSDSSVYVVANHTSEVNPGSTNDWAASKVLTSIVRISVMEASLHDALPGREHEERALKNPLQRIASADEMADCLFRLGSDQTTDLTTQVTAIPSEE